MGDLEAWETVSVLAPQWERQRTLLKSRVDQADAKYKEILTRATGARSSSAERREEGLATIAVAAVALFLVRGRRHDAVPSDTP
jgi:hypothetical protein